LPPLAARIATGLMESGWRGCLSSDMGLAFPPGP
jgi:hypothetical protein